MQISDIIMIYFVIGAVMVGGGALTLDGGGEETGAGIVNFFIENESGQIQPTDNATGQLDDTGGAISSIVSLAVGVALLVWNLVQNLFVYINWPVFVMLQNNAPPMAVLLLGGSFTVAFYMGVVGLLWRAA